MPHLRNEARPHPEWGARPPSRLRCSRRLRSPRAPRPPQLQPYPSLLLPSPRHRRRSRQLPLCAQPQFRRPRLPARSPLLPSRLLRQPRPLRPPQRSRQPQPSPRQRPPAQRHQSRRRPKRLLLLLRRRPHPPMLRSSSRDSRSGQMWRTPPPSAPSGLAGATLSRRAERCGSCSTTPRPGSSGCAACASLLTSYGCRTDTSSPASPSASPIQLMERQAANSPLTRPSSLFATSWR